LTPKVLNIPLAFFKTFIIPFGIFLNLLMRNKITLANLSIICFKMWRLNFINKRKKK